MRCGKPGGSVAVAFQRHLGNILGRRRRRTTRRYGPSRSAPVDESFAPVHHTVSPLAHHFCFWACCPFDCDGMAAGHDLQKRGGGEGGGLVSPPAPPQIAKRDLSGVAHPDSVSSFCSGFCLEYQTLESGTRPRRRSAELRVVRVPCLCHSEVAMRTRSTHVLQRIWWRRCRCGNCGPWAPCGALGLHCLRCMQWPVC